MSRGMIELVAKLRPVVEAATAGPWQALFIGGPMNPPIDIYQVGPEGSLPVATVGNVGSIEQNAVSGVKADAVYLETFDPRTTGALLDLLAALLDGLNADIEAAAARLDRSLFR